LGLVGSRDVQTCETCISGDVTHPVASEVVVVVDLVGTLHIPCLTGRAVDLTGFSALAVFTRCHVESSAVGAVGVVMPEKPVMVSQTDVSK